MSMLQQIVKKKLKQVSSTELLSYSKEYNIALTKKQAKEISAYLKQTKLDPFNENDRMKMFKKLAKITDIQTAQKAQKIFHKLIKEYGVESWFD
ncbi:DUF2624 domain-containing protein [Aquibacillus sp. 3ASR75-11]|uniref:DUF2624 domain-containing protein n=1 Tax=Terrihalobacillus insolitus TaxID=2950438 RepID=A0A9X3WUQ3_9BACI|nr:DUF2624 domain-containing protein [Terrihalobacillus insolitus]MDC3413370.1 DUF2624 domain-containing protein [Terrihalobacillus insolitus]MDC3424953.1 DUF2624 domain-containing protein [Terrihalobacillus insolitus]